ncbi:MAG: UDP-3-O-(3-hydroxymyristoyl)glucosamine N-acyltransferase [Deltaproteobacteria bacterium]|nr:UDP-3-O-(3-hydroxymyristoyl)glucosamine N-acyltransferase [Deltaproteobacteria bacterium]
MKLREISEIIGGTVFGNGEVDIEGVSSIKDAKEGDITFCFRKAYLDAAKQSKATALVIGKDIPIDQLDVENLIVVDDPYEAYLKTINLFVKEEKEEPFISPLAYISEGVTLGENVRIYPFVYIGKGSKIYNGVTLYPFVYIGRNVTIGEESKIYPNVTLYDGVRLGKRVVIHAGSVIGSDGFGYTWDGKRHIKIPQLGSVEIEDDVEIGANVTIDRATLGKTVIGRGTKIDNLVQIGHNVVIGEDCIIVAQVGIGGSAQIGKRVIIAGQVGIRDHVRIEDDVKIGGQSGIVKDIEKGSEVIGTPHMDRREWARLQVYLKQLPNLFSTVKEIKEKIKAGEHK